MELKIRKKLVKKLDPFFFKLYRYLLKFEKDEVALVKQKYLKSFQSVGFNCRLNGSNWIFINPKKIILGNNIHIGNNAYFNAKGGLIIGDNTHISRNVTIYTVNHDYEGECLPYDNNEIHKSVIIGKNVWIGMNVSIVPGVRIGDGAIIGIGSVVGRDVGPLEIIGNSSQKTLKKRSSDHYERLLKEQKYGGVNGKALKLKMSESFLNTYSKNKMNQIVFVLGTGRSGSTSIVEILNQHPNFVAFHEDIRQLIRLSNEKALGEKVYEELNEIFDHKLWYADKNQLIIHSDQRLWNFINYLNDYFPNSKFIHLKRDPVDCVKSMVARGWYTEGDLKEPTHDWARYRLKADEIGVMGQDQWTSLNQIEKCTWYWSYLTSKIDEQLKELPKSKVLHLELNNLDKELEKLAGFLNESNFVFKPIISNKRFAHNDVKFSQINNLKTDKVIMESLNKFYTS
ncbi:sulfotransferase [Neptunitalea lumnitzerae]|uniref:Acyltransferase n=1 Tax=Neptunitalea lumnitzerae TaxID=2965509 RepID=A0ABQ5MN50_9FLAO|nr:DapH/DapD/GlmU-related protein [Neptunitalea sp. Y10]GLB50837.1 hypothetical protein Y10_32050 [Neptunitalea sp. Y10]